MKKVFIGIDNGASGSVGIITPEKTSFYPTPCKKQLHYTKKKQEITRIEFKEMYLMLAKAIDGQMSHDVIVALERPYCNPMGFKSSLRAAMSYECTLIILEELNIPYKIIDSKPWQKEFLPSGIKGAPALKKASLEVGNRLFPQFKDSEAKDRDGILIAEWLRKNY